MFHPGDCPGKSLLSLETPAGVSQDWRSCGSHLHGKVPTGTELLYCSFPECGETGGKGLDKKRFVFGFFFLFSFLFKKRAIEFRIRERLCLWQMKYDPQPDAKLSTTSLHHSQLIFSLQHLPLAHPSPIILCILSFAMKLVLNVHCLLCHWLPSKSLLTFLPLPS